MARSLGTAAGSPMPPGKLEVSPEDADAGQFSIRGTIPKHLQLDRLEPYDPSGRQGPSTLSCTMRMGESQHLR